MLPQAALRTWYHRYDAFKTLPKELAEASFLGAIMTVLGATLCVVLAVCETSAFLTAKPETRLMVDSNDDGQLRINFDVTMLDMSCENIAVGIWDVFGTERMNITTSINKQRLDHKGVRQGRPYTDQEIVELEFSNQSFTAEELAELDSDWGSSSDHFKHQDFQAVINAHHFTMINFFADWCSHCMQFAPTWKKFEDDVNSGAKGLKDADGNAANIRVLKVNCVDFEEECAQQRITHFPAIRLYRWGSAGKKGEEYKGQRSEDQLTRWITDKIKVSHTHIGASFHEIFSEGCRISGHLFAARVPGTVHFQAMHTADRMLNLAVTNVSHTVHHFSFGDSPRTTMRRLPSEYRRGVNPMDGITFATDKFHKAPHHFIKVVHTRFEDSDFRSYQQTHQWSVRTLQRSTIPQAKFSYDIAPVEVIVGKGERRWYDYLTQLLAITGGAFSVFSMVFGAVRGVSVQIKAALGKTN